MLGAFGAELGCCHGCNHIYLSPVAEGSGPVSHSVPLGRGQSWWQMASAQVQQKENKCVESPMLSYKPSWVCRRCARSSQSSQASSRSCWIQQSCPAVCQLLHRESSCIPESNVSSRHILHLSMFLVWSWYDLGLGGRVIQPNESSCS